MEATVNIAKYKLFQAFQRFFAADSLGVSGNSGYFVPNSRTIVGTINEYRTSVHHDVYQKGQVKVCFVEERNFNFISELVLYNVESDKRTRGVQMFPNEMRDYYISLDEHYIVKMVGLLNDLKTHNSLTEI